MRTLVTLLAVVGLFGCAVPPPVPDGYTGPVATVGDTGFREGSTKAQMFVLAEIDGARVINSLDASAAASRNKGLMLTTEFVSRPIPARPMKVKLVATHTTAAPIHEMFLRSTGKFLSVEGTVDFNPAPGGSYIVRGELKKEGSWVWIEDSNTREPATEKVLSK